MKRSQNQIVTALLMPFSLLYGIGVFLRNLFFDTGIFSSHEFSFPVISVGNITVGGTGKTPHVEHIVSILKGSFSIAVLSRGYKRRSSGFVIASTASRVKDVGDEPLQIKRKFPEVEVAVDGDRVNGIRKLFNYNSRLNAVILDDAFQHRWVKPGISILLVDYNQPFTEDSLLPAGRLREPVSSIKRAAIVICSKCPPDMQPIERRIIRKELNLFPWQSLYFTTYAYGNPCPVFRETEPFPEREKFRNMKSPVLMITGIAYPVLFEEYLREFSPRIKKIVFPDHHNYRTGDIRHISKEWQSIENNQKIIITTEKDAIRFRNLNNIDFEIRRKMYYIPVSIRFIEKDGEEFKKQILHYVGDNKRDHIIS